MSNCSENDCGNKNVTLAISVPPQSQDVKPWLLSSALIAAKRDEPIHCWIASSACVIFSSQIFIQCIEESWHNVQLHWYHHTLHWITFTCVVILYILL